MNSDQPNLTHPAIVLAGHGTSDPKAGQVFEQIETAVRRRYPEHDIRRAFSSRFVVEKLARHGVEAQTPPEILAELERDGHRSVVFQSLHVVPGQEYHGLQNLNASRMKIGIGNALLTGEDDLDSVLEILDEKFQPEAANVVVCHGNRRHAEFNRPLIALGRKIEADRSNVVVCSLRGQPGTDKLDTAKRQAARYGRVHFVPLMLATGVHVTRDVLGDRPDSWKSRVGAKETTCAGALGSHEKVLDIYCRHLAEALATLKESI